MVPLDIPEGLLARSLALAALRLALPEATLTVQAEAVEVNADCDSVIEGLAGLWDSGLMGVCGKGECVERLRFRQELAKLLNVSKIEKLDAGLVRKFLGARVKGDTIECRPAPLSMLLVRAEFREYVRVPGGGGGHAKDTLRPCDVSQFLAVIGYCATLAYYDGASAHLVIPPFTPGGVIDAEPLLQYHATLKNIYSLWARVRSTVEESALRLLFTAYAATRLEDSSEDAEVYGGKPWEPIVAVLRLGARSVDLVHAKTLPLANERLVAESGEARGLAEGLASLMKGAARKGGEEGGVYARVLNEYSASLLLFLETLNPDYALAAARSLKPLLSPGSRAAGATLYSGCSRTGSIEAVVEALVCDRRERLCRTKASEIAAKLVEAAGKLIEVGWRAAVAAP